MELFCACCGAREVYIDETHCPEEAIMPLCDLCSEDSEYYTWNIQEPQNLGTAISKEYLDDIFKSSPGIAI